MTQPNEPHVSVEQVDRDAACDVYRRFRYGQPPLYTNIAAGRIDHDPIVQAFARHRHAAREVSAAGEVEDDYHDARYDFAGEPRPAALRLPAEQGWRGIESAPKDGTRVLLWISTGIAMPYAWQNGRWMGDDYPLNMAWPTHWRPLPAAPADVEAR